MRAILLVGLLLGAGTVSESGDGWHRVVERGGIHVDQKSVPGRTLAESRAVVEIAASRWEVLAVITDVVNQPEWVPRLAEVRVLETEEPLRAVFQLRMDMPWPVSDRDAVLSSHTEFPEKGGSITRFSMTSHPDPEPAEGVIRMLRLRGHYALTALEPGRTRVEYLVDADPGGSLPNWLVTRIGRDDPWHTLDDLRKRVAATRGEYAAFLRRWDPKGVAGR